MISYFIPLKIIRENIQTIIDQEDYYYCPSLCSILIPYSMYSLRPLLGDFLMLGLTDTLKQSKYFLFIELNTNRIDSFLPEMIRKIHLKSVLKENDGDRFSMTTISNSLSGLQAG